MPTDRELHDEYQIDQADDDLQRIVDNKLALQQSLDAMDRAFPQIDDLAMRAACEEVYDDTYHDEWHRLAAISCGVQWPTEIPPFGALDFDSPKRKADRAYKEAHSSGMARLLLDPISMANDGLSTASATRPLPNAAMAGFSAGHEARGMVNPYRKPSPYEAGEHNHD